MDSTVLCTTTKYRFTYMTAIDQSVEQDVSFTPIYAEDLHENPRLKILRECYMSSWCTGISSQALFMEVCTLEMH